jgi:hypothetical protein
LIVLGSPAIAPRSLHIGQPVLVPGFRKAARSGGSAIPNHSAIHVGLAHRSAHGVEADLVFGPDLFGEGVAGMVGGGGDVAVEVEQWGERFAPGSIRSLSQ